MGTAEEPEQADAAPEFLTATEVAAWLRVSVHTVRRQAAAGNIPGRRVGKEWRFSREAIVACMSQALDDARGWRRKSSN